MNLKGWQKTGNTNKSGYLNTGDQGCYPSFLTLSVFIINETRYSSELLACDCGIAPNCVASNRLYLRS